MSLSLYSKYRRMGLRHAWRFARMNELSVYVIAGLLAIILSLVLVAWIEDSVAGEYRKGRSEVTESCQRTEQVVLSCLNHGAMIINGEAHECHPVSMKVKI